MVLKEFGNNFLYFRCIGFFLERIYMMLKQQSEKSTVKPRVKLKQLFFGNQRGSSVIVKYTHQG